MTKETKRGGRALFGHKREKKVFWKKLKRAFLGGGEKRVKN